MKILIVDDDSYKVEMVSKYLKLHQIETAISYNSAMRKIIANQYNGIILDMGFPKFDDGYRYSKEHGLLILSEMKRRNIITPVMIFSGNRFDVSDYINVYEYVMSDTNYLKEKIENFISKIEKGL